MINNKISVMLNKDNKVVRNQFILQSEKGIAFQSYNSIIAFLDADTKKVFVSKNWDCSSTTTCYTVRFFNYYLSLEVLSKADIRKAIKAGKIAIIGDTEISDMVRGVEICL